MTPQEKAEELFNKFFDVDVCEEHDVCERISKKCALIAVDEIINEFTHNDIFNAIIIEYWKQVRVYISSK